MLLTELTVNAEYTLRPYASSVLGSVLTNARLISTCNLEMAERVQPGLAERHVAIYHQLPEGTLKDASKLSYLVFRNQNNSLIVLAYEWISPASITVSTANRGVVEFLIASSADVTRVSALLAASGIQVVKAEVKV